MKVEEFLRARLNEEEQDARLALERHVAPDGTPYWPRPSARAAARVNADPGQLAGARIIDTYSPARVLREVTAKRRLLELHTPKGRYCRSCLESESDLYGREYEEAPCLNLRLLALPYADHPDYQQEWAP